MRPARLALRALLPAALVLGALAVWPGLIGVGHDAPAPAPATLGAPGDRLGAGRPGGRAETAMAETQRESRRRGEPLDADQREIADRALGVLAEQLGAARGLPRDWRADYRGESEFLVASPARGRWVTLSAARVPCARVDRALARRGGRLGRPDRCERWRERTRQTLRRHGLDAEPDAFLEVNEIETDVRVMMVYAGWEREDDRIRLVDARPVPVYPALAFESRRREALDDLYRSLDLGPYARE